MPKWNKKPTKTKHEVHFVLANYSWVWDPPWSSADTPSDSCLVKINFPFTNQNQLQMVSWLGIGPCVHISLSVLGPLSDLHLSRSWACFHSLFESICTLTSPLPPQTSQAIAKAYGDSPQPDAKAVDVDNSYLCHWTWRHWTDAL